MPAKKKQNGSRKNGAHAQYDAIEFLKGQHKKISTLIETLSDVDQSAASVRKLQEIFVAWATLVTLQNEIAFPAFEEAGVEAAVINEAVVGSDVVALVTADLHFRQANDPLYPIVVKAVISGMSRVLEHAADNKRGILALAQKAGVDGKALGEVLQERMSDFEHHEGGHGDLRAAAFPRPILLRPMRHNAHLRRDDRHRDDRNRLIHDDDRFVRRSFAGGEERSGRDDPNDNHAVRSRSGGRSTSDDQRDSGDVRRYPEDARYQSDERRSFSDYDDDRQSGGHGAYFGDHDSDRDDDRRSRGRGRSQGGWSGDAFRQSDPRQGRAREDREISRGDEYEYQRRRRR